MPLLNNHIKFLNYFSKFIFLILNMSFVKEETVEIFYSPLLVQGLIFSLHMMQTNFKPLEL